MRAGRSGHGSGRREDLAAAAERGGRRSSHERAAERGGHRGEGSAPGGPAGLGGGLGWERRELGTEFGPVLRGETRPGAGPGPGGQGGPWSGPAVTAVQR